MDIDSSMTKCIKNRIKAENKVLRHRGSGWMMDLIHGACCIRLINRVYWSPAIGNPLCS